MSLSSKPLVLCDIDGCIADCDGPMVARVNRDFGTTFCRDDLVSYYAMDELLTPYLVTKEAIGNYMVSLLTDEAFILAQPLILPALSGLRTLGGVARIHLVTSRPTDGFPQVKTATKAWLDRYGIPYEKLVFRSDKHLYARETGASYLIEDAEHHAEASLAHGVGVFLVDAPYNRKIEPRGGLWRVRSIKDVVPLLQQDLVRA